MPSYKAHMMKQQENLLSYSSNENNGSIKKKYYGVLIVGESNFSLLYEKAAKLLEW